MPFTPIHYPIPLFLCELLFSKSNNRVHIQFLAIFLVSIPDLEGFSYYYLNLPVLPHGFLHSIFGSFLISISFILLLQFYYLYFKKSSFLSVFSKKEGLYLFSVPLIFHLGFDVFMHKDIKLFYPFGADASLFNSPIVLNFIYFLTFISLFLLVIIFQIRFIMIFKKKLSN